MTQVELPMISHQVESEIISQRVVDGYINATAMCKSAGREFHDYKRLTSTEAFIEELSSVTGIPGTVLIQSVSGGRPELQGTWVHPQVAINLGQWLSPKFAVFVSQWIWEWLTGNIKTSSLPYHLRRYMANRSEIPWDQFSILNEMTFAVIAPLESSGYTLPDNLIPDISEGRMFADWLRKEGYNLDKFKKYTHRYENGKECEARLYPNSLLDKFRKHFHETWIPQRMYSYFKERDVTALPHLQTVFILDTAENDKSTKQLKDIT